MNTANMPTTTAASLNSGRLHRAYLRLPTPPHYGRPAFEAGLAQVGYEITLRPIAPKPGDLLVLWNRYLKDEREARAYEAAGATVLIVENPYLAPDIKPPPSLAIAQGHHNGAGFWHVGNEARPIAWPIEPWRTDGDHVLIIPQRGLGEQGVAMPKGWPAQAEHELKTMTKRPIRVRPHPGVRPHPPMDGDLKDCWAAVTWGSGGALKAICAGVPVFYQFPQWIGAPAASRFVLTDIENPYLGDRGFMLHRLSWAQWTIDEIAKGEPFRWLPS
jgi:hypothetical protein